MDIFGQLCNGVRWAPSPLDGRRPLAPKGRLGSPRGGPLAPKGRLGPGVANEPQGGGPTPHCSPFSELGAVASHGGLGGLGGRVMALGFVGYPFSETPKGGGLARALLAMQGGTGLPPSMAGGGPRTPRAPSEACEARPSREGEGAPTHATQLAYKTHLKEGG